MEAREQQRAVDGERDGGDGERRDRGEARAEAGARIEEAGGEEAGGRIARLEPEECREARDARGHHQRRTPGLDIDASGGDQRDAHGEAEEGGDGQARRRLLRGRSIGLARQDDHRGEAERRARDGEEAEGAAPGGERLRASRR